MDLHNAIAVRIMGAATVTAVVFGVTAYDRREDLRDTVFWILYLSAFVVHMATMATIVVWLEECPRSLWPVCAVGEYALIYYVLRRYCARRAA
jgi:hypothetical protein